MQLQILDSLLKFPKKKHIKKLFEHCLVLTYRETCVNSNFQTPIIESLKQQLELSQIEIHKLILSITNLFKIAAYTNFDQQRLNSIFSQRLQQQLKQLIIGMLLSFSDQFKQLQTNRIRQGKQLDLQSLDWHLQTQISNQKGKSNLPIIQITLPLGEYGKSQYENVKFEMKGEQFEVFFNNLTKIKQTLNDLISEGQN